MRNRIIALLLCAGMLLGGCSDHSSSSAGSATIEPDVEDFASETVETPPVSSEAPKDALDGYSGLVIGRWYIEHIDGSLSNGTHYTISLDCLDVDSGEVRNISEFNFDVKSITYQTSTGGWSAEHDFRFESFPIVLCAPAEGFNASYDKMVFDKRVQEREYTAGWIDCEGNFFDVTGTLGLEPKMNMVLPPWDLWAIISALATPVTAAHIMSLFLILGQKMWLRGSPEKLGSPMQLGLERTTL